MSTAGSFVPSREAHELVDAGSTHDTNRIAQHIFGLAPGTGVPLVFTQGETLALMIGRALVGGSISRRHVGAVLDERQAMLRALSAMYDRGERPPYVVLHDDAWTLCSTSGEAARLVIERDEPTTVVTLDTFYERLASVEVEAS